jgi:hypothetical protein
LLQISFERFIKDTRHQRGLQSIPVGLRSILLEDTNRPEKLLDKKRRDVGSGIVILDNPLYTIPRSVIHNNQSSQPTFHQSFNTAFDCDPSKGVGMSILDKILEKLQLDAFGSITDELVWVNKLQQSNTGTGLNSKNSIVVISK